MSNPQLVPLAKVRELDPTWPFSPWSTGRLVREGKLRCVRVGKRIYLTRELLEAFIAKHVEAA